LAIATLALVVSGAYDSYPTKTKICFFLNTKIFFLLIFHIIFLFKTTKTILSKNKNLDPFFLGELILVLNRGKI